MPRPPGLEETRLTGDFNIRASWEVGHADASSGGLGITREHGDISLVEVGEILSVL